MLLILTLVWHELKHIKKLKIKINLETIKVKFKMNLRKKLVLNWKKIIQTQGLTHRHGKFMLIEAGWDELTRTFRGVPLSVESTLPQPGKSFESCPLIACPFILKLVPIYRHWRCFAGCQQRHPSRTHNINLHNLCRRENFQQENWKTLNLLQIWFWLNSDALMEVN